MNSINHPNIRFRSIDIVRGLAIVLMALDHICAYWSPTAFPLLDPQQTTPAWFMTRWITHFCAPAFILLSGVSAYFQLARHGDKLALSRHLLVRGLWLIFLEVVVINLSWKAALPVHYLWIQVIWAIGLSMIVCAGAIWLPRIPLFILAFTIVAGHDLLNGAQPPAGWGWLWNILHQRGGFEVFNTGYEIFIAYPLLPWPGVMLLGYLLGSLYLEKPQDTARWSVLLGLASLCAFVLLRAWLHYGDPSIFEAQATPTQSVMSFLNVEKYPASLQFLSATLGLCLLLLALTQKYEVWGARILEVFGKVPLFFYLLHIPIINLSAHIWTSIKYGRAVNMLTSGPDDWPLDYEPSLWRAYLVWVAILIPMYFICREYWHFKSARRDRWLLQWV